jgi:hypothetical protein
MRDSATRSISPNFSKSSFGQAGSSRPPSDVGPAAAFEGSFAGAAVAPDAAASTSAFRIRPLRPVPWTVPRSTPSSRASRRTPGPA